MLGDAVLTAVFGVDPIKENDVTRVGSAGVILPLVAFFEPVFANIADGEGGKNIILKVAALVGAPTNKYCTPIHSFIEAVPSPIDLTADIADLRECNGNEIALSAEFAEDTIPHRAIFKKEQFVELLLFSIKV